MQYLPQTLAAKLGEDLVTGVEVGGLHVNPSAARDDKRAARFSLCSTPR